MSDASKYIPFLDPNRHAGQLESGDIKADTLEATDIAAGAVAASELASNAVETAKIKDANVTAAKLAADAVTSAKIAANAVKQSELSYETVNLAFGAADTSKTGTVTAGSIIIGQYVSAITATPVASHCQLSISSTTLTGTLTAAPGTSNALTITVVLLKA